MNDSSTSTHLAKQLESITQTIHDAILSADQQGIILSWNRAAENMFQYSASEAIGQPLTLIVPERYKSAHEQGIQRVVNGGPHHVIGTAVELQGLRKDGSEFPIELSLSTWETEEGKFFGGIIRDITSRKREEANLIEAEQKFRSITETANDAIVSANAEGGIVSWNRAAEKIFGLSAEEAIGQSLKIIIPARFHALHDRGMERVNQGGDQHVIGKTAELFGLHKHGHEFPIELSLSTWQVNDKKFYCGILRDISERKQAEATLTAAEQKFRSITETANDAIVSANAGGNIVSWNNAAERIFGYAAAEVMGQSLKLIIPDQFHAQHDQGIERVNQGGEQRVIGKTAELFGLHKEGHMFPIELSLSTWVADGQRFYCGILRDISERKKAETALHESQKKLAEKARKLKEANKNVKLKNEQLEGLSNKLAKYLSRQVYTSIFTGNKDVKIESYRKNLTVFFSDIQGFTELTDRVESEVLTSLLNKYLNEMSKIAIDFGGTIDKFIGDAVMIFFGDPETCGEKQDAIACVKMAIAMREKLVELRAEWERMGIARPLQVRMGINTGYCTVGNFGSEERLDYTIVGGTVNLASRLETAARVDQILISHSTWSLVKEEILCEKKEELKIKGQAYPVQTYEVVDLISEVNAQKEKLKTALEGFNINIDFSRLSNPNRILAKEILAQALAKL